MQSLLSLLPGASPQQAAATAAAGQQYVTTNDGVKLAWERHGRIGGPVVVLIHGWSGSRHYWDLNARPLANRGCCVYSYDQRFHGDSDKPSWVRPDGRDQGAGMGLGARHLLFWGQQRQWRE